MSLDGQNVTRRNDESALSECRAHGRLCLGKHVVRHKLSLGLAENRVFVQYIKTPCYQAMCAATHSFPRHQHLTLAIRILPDSNMDTDLLDSMDGLPPAVTRRSTNKRPEKKLFNEKNFFEEWPSLCSERCLDHKVTDGHTELIDLGSILPVRPTAFSPVYFFY